MTIELVYWFAAGTLSGILVGMLPGVGPSIILLSAYYFLLEANPQMVLVFYCSMLCATQFYGSIPAIAFGVMGEITSAPAVKFGHKLMQDGYGQQAMTATALASLLGGIIGVIGFAVALWNITWLQALIQGWVKMLILIALIVAIIFTSKKKIATSCMIIFGLGIGILGYQSVFDKYFFVKSYGFGSGGIPLEVFMIGFLVLPFLIDQHKFSKQELNQKKIIIITKSKKILLSLKNLSTIFKSSIVGFVLGLLPGLSYMISSNAVAMIESRKTNDNFSILIAAESANNSASIAALIPFLIFAIPVVPSEVLMLGILERDGFNSYTGKDMLSSFGTLIVLLLLTSLFINCFIAKFFYGILIRLYQNTKNFIYPMVIIFLSLILFYIGIIENKFLLTLIVFSFSVVIGFLIKDFNVRLSAVLASYISETLIEEIYRSWLIYIK